MVENRRIRKKRVLKDGVKEEEESELRLKKKRVLIKHGVKEEEESELRLKKKRVLIKHGVEELAARESKFMYFVSDDVLLEILVRLHDGKTLINFGLVCKRLFSLISRSKHFMLQKRQLLGKKLPYSLLINNRQDNSLHVEHLPCHNSSSSSSLSTVKASLYLTFLERNRDYIVSMSEDLFLVQRKYFYIYNPQTRQRVILPNPKASIHLQTEVYRCGFVCKPNCSSNKQLGVSYHCNCSLNYRVVIISSDVGQTRVLHAKIFSSETGQWNESTFQFPKGLHVWHSIPVGSNGIIYWPFGKSSEFEGIVAFDPFQVTTDNLEQCRLISLPVDFSRGWQAKSKRACLGVVRGQLRLSQFYFDKEAKSYVLRVWELYTTTSSSSLSWDLVHNVRLIRSDVLLLIALHPEDGDAFVFKSHNGYSHNICQYKIGSDNFEHVCKLRYRVDILHVFPLVHLWWPTKIYVLPWNLRSTVGLKL